MVITGIAIAVNAIITVVSCYCDYYLYRVFHKKNICFIFSSFLTQMLTSFNNSFTTAFSDEMQKKLA